LRKTLYYFWYELPVEVEPDDTCSLKDGEIPIPILDEKPIVKFPAIELLLGTVKIS